jgi:hypothetical protein
MREPSFILRSNWYQDGIFTLISALHETTPIRVSFLYISKGKLIVTTWFD